MFPTKRYLIFIAFFIGGPARGADFPYWKGIVDLLSGNSSDIKTPACPELQNRPADLISDKDPLIVNACVQDICGKPNSNLAALFQLANLEGSGKEFANRFKEQIAAAVKNASKNELNWLKAQTQELGQKRSFSDLTVEEKILSTCVFAANSEPDVQAALTPQESEKLSSLLKKTEPFNERYTTAYEINMKEASKKSAAQVRSELESLNAAIKAKFGKMRIWNDLQDIVQQNITVVKIEAAANSDYYRKNTLEQYASVKALADALFNKEGWEKTLVDLGNPGKDFPTLTKAFDEHSKDAASKVQNAIQSCAIRVGRRMNNLPTAQKLQSIKSNIVTTKQKIESRFLAKLSVHSQKTLKDILDKIEINLPPSRESYEAAFKAKMERLATVDYADSPSKSRVTAIYDFRTAQSYEKYMADDCDYGILRERADHAIPGIEKINLSELVGDDQVATELIAHELFHTLDPALTLSPISKESGKKIDEIKGCLKSFHSNSDRYLTEDWADAGASLIVSDLPTNSWCPEVIKSGWNRPFSPIDSHSPILFRMLHQQTYKKNGLSDSCKKLLAVQKPVIQIKKCFNF